MKKSEVVEHFGSASKVAKALNITRMAVSAWPEIVPIQRQYELEHITKGALKAKKPEWMEIR